MQISVEFARDIKRDTVKAAFSFLCPDGDRMYIVGESKTGSWYRNKFKEGYPGQVFYLQCADALSRLAKSVEKFHAPKCTGAARR